MWTVLDLCVPAVPPLGPLNHLGIGGCVLLHGHSAITTLAERCPSLTALSAHKLTHLSWTAVAKLLDTCPRLISLDLNEAHFAPMSPRTAADDPAHESALALLSFEGFQALWEERCEARAASTAGRVDEFFAQESLVWPADLRTTVTLESTLERSGMGIRAHPSTLSYGGT